MKKEYYSISDNVTVDVIDFLWNVLEQWKAIVIVAVIVSLLSVGLKYRSDMSAYENAGVQTVTVDSLKESMTKTQTDGVEYAVRQYQLIEKYEDYMDHSALVDIDPTKEVVARVAYQITGADAQLTATIQDAYAGYYQSDAFLDGIREMMPREDSRPYVTDLVAVGSNGTEATQQSAMVVVSIILLPDMDESAVLDYLQKSTTSYADGLQISLGTFALNEVTSDVRTVTDTELLAQQSETIENAFKVRNSQQQIKENFSESQKNLYDLMIEELDNDGKEASMEVAPEHPSLSKKVLVLGFVVGAFLYVFFYLVITLFKNRIKTAKECEDTLDIRTLGELHEFHSNGWKRLFTSKFFFNRKYHNFADTQLQKNRIVDSMAAYVAKHPDAKMQFTSVAPLTQREEAHVRDMMKDLEARGITVDLLVGNIRKDTTFHQNLAKANQMILVLCKDRSIYPDIDLCLELARESEMDIVGNVFVDC